MKHGVRPTREQRKLMQKWNLEPDKWLVTKDTPTEMCLVYRWSDKTIRTLPKGE